MLLNGDALAFRLFSEVYYRLQRQSAF